MVIPYPVMAASNSDCMDCHSDDELSMERNGKTTFLFVDEEQFGASIHSDMGCVECHPDADVEEFPHEDHLARVNCGECHEDAMSEVNLSIHGEMLAKGEPLAPVCADCHGKHNINPSDVPESPTYKMNIPNTCSTCHQEGAPVARFFELSQHNILANYSQSIHGEGLFKRGLIVTAACTDCHGDHEIKPLGDIESTISHKNIATTCMQCHTKIEMVHKKVIRGELWEKEPGSIPACTDCHQPHKIRKENLIMRTSDLECMECHKNPDLKKVVDDKVISLYVDPGELQNSLHRNMPCIKCHSDIDPQLDRPCEPVGKVDCSSCHAKISEEYFQSDHGQAYLQHKPGVPYCTDCHGRHDVNSHRVDTSETFRSNIPKLCGDCHRKHNQEEEAELGVQPRAALADYSMSVHGQSLEKKGLLPSAICTDCHGIHSILEKDAPDSSVAHVNIAATCGTCHQGIFKEFVQSIHNPEKPEPGKSYPICSDCHSAHTIKETEKDKFMAEVTNQCGTCHKYQAENYFDTMHGKAYKLGYMKAARCSDCHGAHHVLGINDPESSVGFRHAVETCQKCHPDANQRFTGYLSHATHHDRDKYPFLFFAFWGMTLLLVSTLTFFAIHTLLWLPKSFKQLKAKKQAKHPHRRYYFVRFSQSQRFTHLLVIISFMTLALTGMMLKFAGMPWAVTLANMLGGVAVAGAIHRIGAVITFGYFGYHLFNVWQYKRKNHLTLFKLVFGEDSMMFNMQDLKDFINTMKWFLGKGPRPQYGRWTYWEKFDYFAVFWGVGIIGLTGLMLWFPEFFTRFMPGWLLNVAMIIHSDEALLAVGFIFTIHFFNTHLRPEAFPMDPVIFTGSIPVDEYKEDRPREYEELRKSGKLKKRIELRKVSPGWHKLVRVFGYSALALGLIIIGLIIYSMLFGYH